MKRNRHTEEQTLKEHEAGMKTAELCRKHVDVLGARDQKMTRTAMIAATSVGLFFADHWMSHPPLTIVMVWSVGRAQASRCRSPTRRSCSRS